MPAIKWGERNKKYKITWESTSDFYYNYSVLNAFLSMIIDQAQHKLFA